MLCKLQSNVFELQIYRKNSVYCLTITTIVASRRVLVDVGDRRADGNGHEDEEPREAAYRPRLRHPRDGE